MSTTTTERTARATSGRSTISWLKQALRLTRTEFVLFVRYKTAWMFLILPLVFLFTSLQMPNEEVFEGVRTVELSMAGVLGSIGVMLGLGHASNVFTARREALVLKRLRVSGVPPMAIFGGVTGVVVLFSLFIAAVMAGLIAAFTDAFPRDPLMLAVAVSLSAVSMTLLGLLITPLVRNAEAAQMLAMVPMMLLLFTGGVFFPLDLMPDTMRQVVQWLPVAPLAQMAQAAYTGYDVFGGYTDAEALGYLELWVAALPSVGVVLAWTVLLALLVHRVFKWDPRQP